MEDRNPFAAPLADVSVPPIEVPEPVRKQIKHAWVAACVSGTITLVVLLLVVSGTFAIPGVDAWVSLDVAIIFGLAYGIYRKSRTCAVIMLVYFVVSKIIAMVEAGKPSGLLMAAMFTYFFVQGVVGTFAYHRLKAAAAAGTATRPGAGPVAESDSQAY